MFPLSRLRGSFLLTLVALSGMCVFLKTLKAADMQMAAADLAVASTAKCDEWRKPGQFDEAWESVSFNKACAAHDVCYHTPGASWSLCNQKYQKDLRSACDQALDPSLDPSLGPSLAVCYDIADQYFNRVQRPVALRKFQNAQISVEVAETPEPKAMLVKRVAE